MDHGVACWPFILMDSCNCLQGFAVFVIFICKQSTWNKVAFVSEVFLLHYQVQRWWKNRKSESSLVRVGWRPSFQPDMYDLKL
jgi:hypothetical protein